MKERNIQFVREKKFTTFSMLDLLVCTHTLYTIQNTTPVLLLLIFYQKRRFFFAFFTFYIAVSFCYLDYVINVNDVTF